VKRFLSQRNNTERQVVVAATTEPVRLRHPNDRNVNFPGTGSDGSP
jgi:hypothetical protein